MEALLYLLPALGCGLMMVVMMVFMARVMAPPRSEREDDSRTDELASLPDEVDRLGSGSNTGARADG